MLLIFFLKRGEYMTPDNMTGNADLKVQSLFDNIEDLLEKKKYEVALEIIEENKSFLQKYSDMKYQVLLNKYYADSLYHVTLFAYERDSDEMLFERLFLEHRSYFEVHLDKKNYARLLKIEGFIKKRKRAKRMKIIAPIVIIAVLAGSFLIYKAFDKGGVPAAQTDGNVQNPPSGETDNPAIENGGPDSQYSNSSSDPDINENTSSPGSENINSDTDNPLDSEGSENISDGENADYLLPSDTRELTRADIQGMSAKDVRLAINEMYARKGYNFGAGANQRYFDEKSWYIKNEDLTSAEDVAAKFTNIENTNLSFLAAEERRLKNN